MAKAAYVVRKGRKPGVYTDWNLVSAQIDGVSGASQRGYKTVEEAQRDYKLLKREGKLVACPDSVDDDSDTSEVSINGRGTNGNSTSASRTSGRGSSARTRARAGAARAGHTHQPVPDASGDEDGGRARERDAGRQRARAPVSPARQDRPHAKTEPGHTGAASPRSTRPQTRETPVHVHTDDDSDGPQPRSPLRRDPRAPHTESQPQAGYRRDPLHPEPHESVSSPPKRSQAPGMTRENSQSTQYHSARSVADSDQDAARERKSRGRANSSASMDSIPDSSSAPTGESQYEDPDGGISHHERRRADIDARKARRDARAKEPVAVSDAESTEPESVVDYVEMPSTSRAETPKRPRAPPAQRARTEPVVGSTPVTPVPLAKSRSMPASANGSARMSCSMRYKVCGACHQPVPQPPLLPPEDASTSRQPAACGRCFQSLPRKRADSARSNASKSPAQSEKTVKSSPKPTSPTVNESVNTNNEEVADDFLNSLGLSPFPKPFDAHPPPDDPRSPYKGSTNLPMRGASAASLPFAREATFNRPSPTASVDGRAGHSRLNSLSSQSRLGQDAPPP